MLSDTLAFTLGSVAVGFAVAFTLAWLVERTDLPGRGFWFTLILFPLLVPTVMLAIAWIYLFGPNAGWVNRFFAAHGLGALQLNIFTFTGLILCQAVASVPFLFLLLSAVLRTMNPALEEAAAASGASPFKTFWRVTLPILRPGTLAPLILITLITLEQFELPLIIGMPAKITVFSTRIFYELNPASGLPNYGVAAATAVPFLLLGFLLLASYNWTIRRAERFVTISGRGYRVRRIMLGRWRWPALAFVLGFVLVASVLPSAVLVWTSLFKFLPFSLDSLSQASLDGYRRLFENPRFFVAVKNTFIVAVGSAFIATAIGAALAWILVRTRLTGRWIVDVLSFVSIGIPSVIAGLGTMLFYLNLPLGLYGTVWILVLAYSYRLAVTSRLSRASLMQIHKELEEAAYASGAAWTATIRRVVLPILAPSLAASFILLFIVGFREFTLALVLLSGENEVLSVFLYRFFENGETDMAGALATLVILFVVPVIFLARKVFVPTEKFA
jgi:iron(III) transport system permease protein